MASDVNFKGERVSVPWKDDTIPPLWELLGLPKYSMNLGWEIVDEIMPESKPKRKQPMAENIAQEIARDLPMAVEI